MTSPEPDPAEPKPKHCKLSHSSAMDFDKTVEAMDTQDDNEIDPPNIQNLTNAVAAAPPAPTSEAVVAAVAAAAVAAANGASADGGGEAMALDDQDFLNDEVRSEATFSYVITKFSRLTESILSPPVYVRNLPWKILAMPRNNDNSVSPAKGLGFFLQCNGESTSNNWNCSASAELRLLKADRSAEPFIRRIRHTFCMQENDWGFSSFMNWQEILDPANGFIENDTITLEVYVNAEPPRGIFWDSKKHTGYVGLKNQGATCYMNSLLQTLYFTNQLRKAVYKMPTEADDDCKSVALALQRVFHDLQTQNKPVGTKKLTKSFGWDALDSFMQHDVQEFLRVLLDKLENKMKGTSLEGTIPKLFEGKMISYIKCQNIDYTSRRTETFYDIQLNIKGKKNIQESFKDYIATEILDDDNKYDAGEHGLQKAEKGILFMKFPPVLHLHLMRFQYDPISDNSVKFNDRFEFDEKINLDPFLESHEETPATYILHAVLVHSGDNHGGHYVVYINPKNDGKWCKFDDDVVCRCSRNEAIEQNYGGHDNELNMRHSSNAYMLVYVRESVVHQVLEEVKESDIPEELLERLNEQRRIQQVRRTERTEASNFVNLNILLADYMEVHQKSDLFDATTAAYRTLKVRKTTDLASVVQQVGRAFKVDQYRLWEVKKPANQKPHKFEYIDPASTETCAKYASPETKHSCTIFLELPLPGRTELEPVKITFEDTLLFFKFYDPVEKRLNYCGHGLYKPSTTVAELVRGLNKRAYFEPDTELQLYEVVDINKAQKITDQFQTLQTALSFLCHGTIVVFEKLHPPQDNLEFPTCEAYFKDLFCRMEVIFLDTLIPNDTGFTLDLSSESTYDQIAKAVGRRINVNPYEIQFFKSKNYSDLPGQPLSHSYAGSLREVLQYSKTKTIRKLFYQKLSININELENKKQFRCLYLMPNLKEEKELILYPNKNGTVRDLLEEARKVIEFAEASTKQLRISELSKNRLSPGPADDTPLDQLHDYTENPFVQKSSIGNQTMYRIEEVAEDEVALGEHEMLVPVLHFTKDISSVFGIPFFIRTVQDETFASLKERMKKKLGVSDKEWEKYRLAIITEHIDYIDDEMIQIKLETFRGDPSDPHSRTFLGLEHINKNTKRSRFNYMEKAIKIYN
ncbi:ubiquitin carboxyl-terminal hydrolase 7 isoform X1 [Anopheles gambiae]|uniref:ubiquitin carboxyl-terminal hydrolase 7 isoform X1 n=2 Tax=Anopheles gambiae TaxID=7165 RepID=UPI002AC917EE|nr:ubiquitin carboxyl-terminal hydrolase 7 isoform X1 [Anopheles gambiae]